MDKDNLSGLIENVKFELGESLIACDIWERGVGISIAGYNSQPTATALFDHVTEYLDKTLMDSDFDLLSEYYILKLKNNSIVLILLFKKYTFGFLLDGSKINMNYIFTNLVDKIWIKVAMSLEQNKE
jgi:hypothetical protein